MTAFHVEIADRIRSRRFYFWDEDRLQEGIAAALSVDGYAVKREVRLSPRDRIDLLVGTVGIEVKRQGTLDALERQLLRYATHPEIEALVVVTSRYSHQGLPAEIGEVPVEVVMLGDQAL